jgi:hypothetical protein
MHLSKFHAKRKLTILALTLALGVGLALPAQATTSLDFSMGPNQPTTAKISYAGGTTPLIGVDINVFNLTLTDTPNYNGQTLTVLGGRLSFTTGNYSGISGNEWSFSGGGNLQLMGDVGYYSSNVWQSLAIGTLVTGNFSAAGVLDTYYQKQNSRSFEIAFSNFQDTKNDALETALGLPTNTHYFGNFNLGFYVSGDVNPPSNFSSTSAKVGSGNIISFVPTPSTLLLLGSGLVGLVGLVGLRFRRKRKI